MRRIGKILLVLAAPAILWLGYEAIVLRWLHGPQNLLFSVAHGYPSPAASVVIALSAVAAVLLLVYSVVVGAFVAFGRLRHWGRLRIQMGTVFVPLVLIPLLADGMQTEMSAFLLSVSTAVLAVVIGYFVFLCVRVWRAEPRVTARPIRDTR